MMRPIHLAEAAKRRPVLVLTRSRAIPYLSRVTIAPITTHVRGLPTEVAVGTANGLDERSVVSCDNLETIPLADLGPQIGRLLPEQEPTLAAAIIAAFDLAE